VAIVVHDLIEQHVSRYLGEIFSIANKPEPLAALVVFDDIARIFRFGGYTKAFKRVLSLDEVRELGSDGMEMQPGGLLSYAIGRFQKELEETWGYALHLTEPSVLEANLTYGAISKEAWIEVPENKSRAGSQLVDFTRLIASHLGPERAKDTYLILLPFSALRSSKGLVLIVWIENDLSLPPLDPVLDFLKSQGPFLSFSQILTSTGAERGNSAGYRRLARLIEHEENGYLRTFETLVTRLEVLEKHNKLLEFGIEKSDIDFFKDRLRSKKQLTKEMSNFDSLNNIPKELLYNEETDLLVRVKEIVANIGRAQRTSKLKTITYEFGDGVTQNPMICLNHYIIDRIIKNAVKNSTRRCEPGKQFTSAIYLDILTMGERRYLRLTIDDDAGGLSEECRIIPRELTPQAWSYFCAERPDIIRPDKGVGLWIISRYAYSLDGKFLLEDVLAPDGTTKGLRYNILMGLQK
jgi:hypothetical protein